MVETVDTTDIKNDYRKPHPLKLEVEAGKHVLPVSGNILYFNHDEEHLHLFM